MLKNKKGSVTLIVILMVIVASLISIYGLKIAMNNYDIKIFDSEKIRSNRFADIGLTAYIDRIKEKYINREELDTLTVENDIMNGSEIDGKYTYTYDSADDYTSTVYTLGRLDEDNLFEHNVYHLNPPLETDFKEMEQKLDKNVGQIAVEGIYNEIVNSLEFYSVAYDNTENKVKFYMYQPFIDPGFNLESEISVNDLYKTKDPTSEKKALSLNDDIKIKPLWNANFNSLQVYFAIGDEANSEIDVFRYNPYMKPIEIEYVDGLEGVDFKQIAFTGVYDRNVNDIELYLVTLDDTTFKIFNSHPSLGEDGNFQNTLSTFADDVDVEADKLDASILWNKTMNSANLYIGAILDTKDTINYYLFLPYISSEVTLQTEMVVNTANQGVDFRADQMALTSYFDTNFNAPQLYMVYGDSESKTANFCSRFVGEDKWNIYPINLTEEEDVGRFDIGSAYQNLTEVVFVNPTPIMKILRVENAPTDYNIMGMSYKNGVEKSRSELKPKIRFEFLEPEVNGPRRLERIEVLNIDKN